MSDTYTDPSAQQAETEVVTGVVTGIITKGVDKWQVAVKTDPSSQYSRNLWTKDGDLVAQLSQLIGSPMSFHCGVSHWNMNDGTPVRSLWINGVGPAQAQAQQQPGTQQVAQAMHPQQVFGQQPQQQGVMPQPQMAGPSQSPYQQPQTALPAPQAPAYDDDPKQGKIHRQTASKVGAILLGYLPAEERTLDTLLTVSERLVAYYDNGMPETVPANDAGDFPPGW